MRHHRISHHGAKNGCEEEPDMSQVLILTATITPPPGVPILARTDPQLRLQDYIDALKFYLAVPNHVLDRIIFAENSGSDLSKLRALAEESDKRVEFGSSGSCARSSAIYPDIMFRSVRISSRGSPG